jgi:hypothetical protein
MSEPVHLFIASTTGLVSIPALVHRNGESLASFVSIAGGSKLSAITPDYRHFVDKSVSPLAGYFGHDSYHMVLGTELHQGQSWQLGAALAHILAASNTLGNGKVAPGDKVIIASGEIDAVNADVRLVSHLAQKCLQAQKTIIQWQQQHCRVSFFVPEENYRQPLPDIPFALTPISNIANAEQWLLEQGHITQSGLGPVKKAPMAISSGLFKAANNAASQTTHQLVNTFGTLISRAKPSNPAQAGDNSLTSMFAAFFKGSKDKQRKLAIVCLIVGLIAVLWTLKVGVFHANKTQQVRLSYEQKVLDRCDAASNTRLSQQQAPQSLIRFRPLKLSTLCALQVSFEYLEVLPSDVWLVADSYALLPLATTNISDNADDSSIMHFKIPLPQWQETSREYFLLVFKQAADRSDRQSLEAYLQRLHQQQQPISLELLLEWQTKQGLEIDMVRHSLEL